ncbi:MAG: hypothetical protein CUN52_10975 [Phototrophicales bacterium]|nr:MAG: hypothetical protein CUN52_10975 [Phototrophicales bacterium]
MTNKRKQPYPFGDKLKAYRRQIRYGNHNRMTGENLAKLLKYQLGESFFQQDIADWENDQSVVPAPDVFLAIMQLFSFHGGFKTWIEAQDLLTEYKQTARFIHPTSQHLTFTQTDYAHWRSLSQKINQHLPEHIRNQIDLLVDMDERVQTIANDIIANTHAISIEGHGGIGKTSLVVVVATKLSGTGVFDGVYFVGVRQGFLDNKGDYQTKGVQIFQLDEALTELGNQMGLVFSPSTTTEQKMTQIAHDYQQRRIILIIDNLETQDDILEFQAFINQLLQVDSASRLMITSRKNLDGINDRIQQIKLQELNADQVYAMLQKRDCPITQQNAHRLHAHIGGNPLAVRLFSGLLKKFPFDELLQQLAQTKSQWDTTDDDFKRHNNLFDYLYERILETLSPNARDLCWHLGMNFEMERGVKMKTIATDLDRINDPTLKPALSDLLDVYLLHYDGHSEVYTMHRLTVHYIRKHFLTST